jgi:hypothetical protein
MKSGANQTELIKALMEKAVDLAEDDIQEAIDLQDPLNTSFPEDIQARYGITDGSLVGQELADEVDHQSQIGELPYLESAIKRYLIEAYSFPSLNPSVTILAHGDLDDPRKDDWHAFTVAIPAVDESANPIPLDDPGLLAEIERVGPAEHYAVTNGAITRSGPYIKLAESEDGDSSLETIEVLPDDIRASSTYMAVGRRIVRDVPWIEQKTTIDKMENFLAGEAVGVVQDLQSEVLVEAPNGTYIDDYESDSVELTPNPELLEGFGDPNPNLEAVGITGIAAEEPYLVETHGATDRLISRGEQASVKFLPGLPPDLIPFTVTEAFQSFDNPPSDRYLEGRKQIFNNYLTADPDSVTKLWGREITVYKAPLDGGNSNKVELAINPFKFQEQFVPKDPNLRKPSPGEIVVEFARRHLDGPQTDRAIDREFKAIERNLTLTFTLTVSGASAGSTQSIPGGNAEPGFVGIPVHDPSSVNGVSQASGFPAIPDPDRRNIRVQKYVVKAFPAEVSIGNQYGPGTQIAYTQTMVPVSTRPDWDMLSNAGACHMLGITVDNFFDMINFPAGGAQPGLVDIAWTIKFEATVIFDLMELQDAEAATEADVKFEDFDPNQTYRCVEAWLEDHTEFKLEERQFVEPEPGWTTSPANLTSDAQSIAKHRLKYDKFEVPEAGRVVRAFSRHEISEEQDSQTLTLTVPTLEGLLCDRVEIRFGYQVIIVRLTDTQQIREHTSTPGFPIFKTVRLDQVVDAETSSAEGIATVLAIYAPALMEEDMVLEAWANYIEIPPSLSLGADIEDLEVLSFSCPDDPRVEEVTHNLPAAAVFLVLYTEADTGHIMSNPYMKNITGGRILYWRNRLPDEGLLAEVKVKYEDAPLAGDALPRDMEVLSVSVPQRRGNLSYFEIIGIIGFRLWYVDVDGIYRQTVTGDSDIRTLEVHYDKNSVPETGSKVEVYANYGPPGPEDSLAKEVNFSVRPDLYLIDASFDGIDPQKILYEKVTGGIVESLSEPTRCRNVTAFFSGFLSSARRQIVTLRTTYEKQLKEMVLPVRQDYPVEEIAVAVSGLHIKSIEADAEFGGLTEAVVGGIYTLAVQRMSAVRVLYYDDLLVAEPNDDLDVQLTVRRTYDRRVNPWIEGTDKWSSPSGLDERYRIDLKDTTLTRIDVTGKTSSARPIMVWEEGYEQPYEQGKKVRPSYIVLTYRQLTRVRVWLDVDRPIHDHHHNNVVKEDETYWRAPESLADDQLELTAKRALDFNQVIIPLDETSVTISSVRIDVAQEQVDWISKTFSPVSTEVGQGGALKGATVLPLLSTDGLERHSIIGLGDQYVRITRVRSDSSVEIDPLEAPVAAGETVTVVGWDFGDEALSSSKLRLTFVKGSTYGSCAVKFVKLRAEHRLLDRHHPRNTQTDNSATWVSEGGEDPAKKETLDLLFDGPRTINRLLFDGLDDAEVGVLIAEHETGVEREVFLSQNESSKGFFYGDPRRADNPKYKPEMVTTAWVRVEWRRMARNPDTGLYQARVTRARAQFVQDRSNSSIEGMLDPSLSNRWRSMDVSDTTSSIEMMFDLGSQARFNRIAITSGSPGATAQITACMGDVPACFEDVATIPDITEPDLIVSRSLSADSGVSEVDPTLVFLSDTSGFEVDRHVTLSADDLQTTETRKIEEIVTDTHLKLTRALTQDYQISESASVEQSNIRLPGGIGPAIMGESVYGQHIRGPHDFTEAFVLPETEARFVKLEVSNIPVELGGTLRRLDLTHVDVFREDAIP